MLLVTRQAFPYRNESYFIFSRDGWLIRLVGLRRFTHKLWEEFVFETADWLDFYDIRIIIMLLQLLGSHIRVDLSFSIVGDF